MFQSIANNSRACNCPRKLVLLTIAIMAPITVASLTFLLFAYLTIPTRSLVLVEATGQQSVNNRPIIGVLAQEISYGLNKKYPEMYHSYIAASYVKFVEGAGARVVPIWIGQPQSYYEDVMSKVNGILWPGGATFFNNSNGYADAGYKIYRIAERLNADGDYFPILGICLGFELMTYVAADRAEHRIDCHSQSQPLPLEFKNNFRKSRLFKNAPADIINILKTESVTANYHRYCITEEGLASVDLDRKFRVMSLNHDLNGVKFISSLEHTSMPFYGVQFHPEKNMYEWITGKRIPHSANATRSARYFADFFVNEARKNGHTFSSTEEEAMSLIYNYPVTYTGLKKSSYIQSYMFESANPSVSVRYARARRLH